MPNELATARKLGNVVKAGLGATQMSGIQSILASIAEEMDSCGCILWEASPGSNLDPQKRAGGFFALAQWFETGEVWGQSDLTVESATGHTVAHDLPYYVVEDLRTDTQCYKASFLINSSMTKACIVPLHFADGARGCLNVFRKSNQRGFTEFEAQLVQQMTELLPPLYETVRDEVAYRCSRDLNDRLQSATATGRLISDFLGVLQEFCVELASNLNCLDVSVYLQSGSDTDLYELVATTLAPGVSRLSYRKGDSGPGAQPLRSGSPLRILDLCDSSTYPVEVGRPNDEYVKHLTNHPRYKQGSPLSFIAAPIVAGTRILGVMRCCAATIGPTYFASREVDLLTLLAGQIGHVVSDSQNKSERDREHEAYKILVESATSVTRLVYDELKAKNPDEDRVLQNCLGAIAKALPGDQWLGVGIRSSNGEYHGRSFVPSRELPWKQKSHLVIPSDWERQLKSDVLLTKASDIVPFEVPHNPPQTGEGRTSLLLCSINCLGETWLLEIANLGNTPFPKHARAIAQLLGAQLGLYHDLLTTIAALKLTQSELVATVEQEKRTTRAHAQAMMDLEHQIRAPLRHARMRVPVLLKMASGMSSTQLTKQLQYLKGTLRRAGRVAANSRLFSRLASGYPIECAFESVPYEDLKLMLIEAAMDNYLIADESKGMTFGVEEEGFAKLSGTVKLDKDLLDQALNDLLDNAAKYGDERSHVRIEVSVSKAFFAISVLSKGLKIAADQVLTLKKRGERGAVARLAAGEGSGIGLWIADEIMKAHHGMLDIVPTTPERLTRIRLMFPLQRT